MANLSNATPTYVLQRTPYTDSQDILRTFTLSDGRVDVVLRGKKNKAELFTPYVMQFAGQSALKTARYLDAAGPSHTLQHQAMFCALYVNELLYYLLPMQEPFPLIFASYSTVLTQLGHGYSQHPTTLLLRLFEGACIESLGLHPNLGIDHNGNSIAADASYRLNSQLRFELYPHTQASNTPLFMGSTLVSIASKLQHFGHGQLADALAHNLAQDGKALRQIYQPILAQLLGHKTLLSRKLWQASNP